MKKNSRDNVRSKAMLFENKNSSTIPNKGTATTVNFFPVKKEKIKEEQKIEKSEFLTNPKDSHKDRIVKPNEPKSLLSNENKSLPITTQPPLVMLKKTVLPYQKNVERNSENKAVTDQSNESKMLLDDESKSGFKVKTPSTVSQPSISQLPLATLKNDLLNSQNTDFVSPGKRNIPKLPSGPKPVERKEFKYESQSLVERHVIRTKGEGDCALHAILGEWSQLEGQVVCADIEGKREKIRTAIVNKNNEKPLQYLIIAGIKELMMSGRNIGKFSQALLNRYRGFISDQKYSSSVLWSQFEVVLRQQQHLLIMKYIQNKHCLPGNPSLYNQFYDALNQNDGELYGRILSLPALHEAFQEYNQLQNTEFDWNSVISLEVKQEYADFVGTRHAWLLPSELAIIANVFHVTVIYYPNRAASPLTLNPKGQSMVAVQFNGSNHFERLNLINNITATILPDRQVPKEIYQEIASKKGHFPQKDKSLTQASSDCETKSKLQSKDGPIVTQAFTATPAWLSTSNEKENLLERLSLLTAHRDSIVKQMQVGRQHSKLDKDLENILKQILEIENILKEQKVDKLDHLIKSGSQEWTALTTTQPVLIPPQKDDKESRQKSESNSMQGKQPIADIDKNQQVKKSASPLNRPDLQKNKDSIIKTKESKGFSYRENKSNGPKYKIELDCEDEEDEDGDLIGKGIPGYLPAQKTQTYQTLSLPNDEYYDGTVDSQCRRQGLGISTTPDSYYVGPWDGDVQSGLGFLVQYQSSAGKVGSSNKSIYERQGLFVKGEFIDGYGSDGDMRDRINYIYQGPFKNGKFDGLGRLIISCQPEQKWLIDGEWCQGKLKTVYKNEIENEHAQLTQGVATKLDQKAYTGESLELQLINLSRLWAMFSRDSGSMATLLGQLSGFTQLEKIDKIHRHIVVTYMGKEVFNSYKEKVKEAFFGGLERYQYRICKELEKVNEIDSY